MAKSPAAASASSAVLTFAQAQDHAHRIIAEFKSLKHLADVLDAAVSAESQLMALQAERDALTPLVDRMKQELELLGAGHAEKKQALNGEIERFNTQRAEAEEAWLSSLRLNEAAHSKRMRELEAEYSSRGDALRHEIATLTEQRDAALLERDEAIERYAAFKRSLAPA